MILMDALVTLFDKLSFKEENVLKQSDGFVEKNKKQKMQIILYFIYMVENGRNVRRHTILTDCLRGEGGWRPQMVCEPILIYSG